MGQGDGGKTLGEALVQPFRGFEGGGLAGVGGLVETLDRMPGRNAYTQKIAQKIRQSPDCLLRKTSVVLKLMGFGLPLITRRS